MTGGAVSLAGYVDQFRKKEPNLVWVVTGDMFMGHYLDSLTKGKAMIEFLNMIPPDCFTLGNHEFDYGMEILKKRIDESKFPIVCANIKTGDGKFLVKPYIIREINGTRVLFIGVICQNLNRIVSVNRLGGIEVSDSKSAIQGIEDNDSKSVIKTIEVTDPKDAILEWTNKLDRDVDLTVVLSHSGLSADRRIARDLPPESGVDIIIGGHSHDLMEKPEVINGIIICQAGSKGRYLGYLQVDVDLQKNHIESHSWELIPTLCDTVRPNKDVERWLARRTKKISKQMEKVIGNLEGEWSRDKDKPEWLVANFATDAIAEEMKVDIGIYNRGGIRKSLTGPKIRLKDVWGIFPFGNYMVSFRLTGRQVETLLEKHLSFSGEHLFFSKSVRYTFDPKRPLGDRLVNLMIQGKPLDPDRLYTIGTIDFLWGHAEECFGLSKKEIKANGGFKEYHDLIDRDIFIEKIKRIRNVKPHLDRRVKALYY
jgi:2',3'-cyclic-nucleotide 2'-phosphodiesterase (5'-nucleotidase family)